MAKRLNEQVRRNTEGFPEDFVLRPTNQELASLRSQIATLEAGADASLRSQFAILKTGRGQHRKYPPLAFTEHGAVMAATILNSPRAVSMSVYVVRAFVRLRTLLEGNAQLDADTRRQFKELRTVVFSLASPPVREQ